VRHEEVPVAGTLADQVHHPLQLVVRGGVGVDEDGAVLEALGRCDVEVGHVPPVQLALPLLHLEPLLVVSVDRVDFPEGLHRQEEDELEVRHPPGGRPQFQCGDHAFARRHGEFGPAYQPGVVRLNGFPTLSPRTRGGLPIGSGRRATGAARSPMIETLPNGYLVSDEPERIDVGVVHGFLSGSYWAKGIPVELVERSIRNCIPVGCYTAAGAQVGLARFISDYATFCYVADVFVLEAHRGKGLSKAIMSFGMRHPRLQGLRRWNLVTLDAHGLYAGFGFSAPRHPERYMEKVEHDIYLRRKDEG
jgi:Acetyltransferase (GNAT) domain